jgi:hypothetical protein
MLRRGQGACGFAIAACGSSIALCESDMDGARRRVREKASGLDSRLALIEERMRERREGREPIRVLITGFCDWKGLQGDLWRVRDNPSGRLLVGAARAAASADCVGSVVGGGEVVGGVVGGDVCGELPRRLRALRDATAPTRPVQWTFRLKPVVWDYPNATPSPTPFCGECLGYDYVVHLGLGVYDRTDEILVEHGATNLARGTDVRGVRRGGAGGDDRAAAAAAAAVAAGGAAASGSKAALPGDVIDAHFGHVLLPPAHNAFMAGALARVECGGGGGGGGMALPGGFVARLAEARDANSYLCNQTNWKALRALHLASAAPCPGRLKGAFFLHIPYAEREDEFGPLAAALTSLIATLLSMAVDAEEEQMEEQAEEGGV